MNAAERLARLLDERDEEIEQLKRKLEEVEIETDSRNWYWARHKRLEDDGGLPVPRLEMRWHKIDDHSWEWLYGFVYQHFLKDYVLVPMGHTKVSGRWSLSRDEDDLIAAMPIRDGAHIIHDMAQLNLPAYVIVGDKVQRIDPKLTPWER